MFDRICKIISSQLDIDIENIKEDTDIAGDLGADSLDVVELLNALEDEFGVVIPQDAVSEIKTVGDLADFMDKIV